MWKKINIFSYVRASSNGWGEAAQINEVHKGFRRKTFVKPWRTGNSYNMPGEGQTVEAH
jgi:hypothetical protein